MAFLLQARFNSTGPTSSDIKNLGGVSFTETSPCRDGSRCAYFYPLDDRGGLEVIGNTRLKLAKALSEENNSCPVVSPTYLQVHAVYHHDRSSQFVYMD